MNPSEVSDALEELVLTPFDSGEFAYGFAAAQATQRQQYRSSALGSVR
ncbi:hypothetical protein [Roseovarius sp. TE539]|nr:hypothetical protein [Roseovarius sp. TE539]